MSILQPSNTDPARDANGVPTEHGPVLIVGSSHDVPAIADQMRHLPANAHGRVVIEAVSAVQIRCLPNHPGLSVTWLLRGVDRGRPIVRKGERLLFALNAWVVEWMPESSEQRPYVWVGASDCPLIQPFVAELARRIENVR